MLPKVLLSANKLFICKIMLLSAIKVTYIVLIIMLLF